MIPGLRILLAIVLLSVSVLIFGLGAAAFLRAAHENFATAPSWRPIETVAIERREPNPPTFAMLRIEPEPSLTPAPPDPALTEPVAVLVVKPPSAPVPAPAEPAPAIEPVLQTLAPPEVAPQVEQAAIAPPEPPSPSPSPPALPPAILEDASAPVPGAAAPLTVTRSPELAPLTPQASATTEVKEIESAPAVVAALNPEKIAPDPAAAEPSAPPSDIASPPVAKESAATVANLAAPPPIVEMPQARGHQEQAIQTDATPPAQIAALAEPELPKIKPLSAREVKLPNPRIDPAVLEARRKRLREQEAERARQRANARAVQARRVAAAAKARAARAATATADPFGLTTSRTATSQN